MPVCNDGDYVKFSVESILRQTYKSIELIIIDSSDDDETTAILHAFTDKRIKYFYQKKNGIANALNLGLEKATGDYIARMDADDISTINRIEKQVDYLECNSQIGVLGREGHVIDSNGNIIGEIAPKYYSDSEIKSKIIFENCIIHPSIMMKAVLVKNGWRYDANCYSEDLDLWTRMAAKGIVFANLPDKLILYRRTENSLVSASQKISTSVIKSSKKYVEELFKIKNDICEEDFTRPYYSDLIKTPVIDFILRQFLLLNIIYERNKKLSVIKEKDLIRELNSRWVWVLDNYGRLYSSFFDYDSNFKKIVQNSDTFFIEELKKYYNNPDINVIKKNLEIELNKAKQGVENLLKSEARIIIYGLGKYGKRFIEKVELYLHKNVLKWELIAVVDKVIKTYTFFGCDKKTIFPDELKKLEFDYIIIPTKKYLNEIKKELLNLKIPKEKIFAFTEIPTI